MKNKFLLATLVILLLFITIVAICCSTHTTTNVKQLQLDDGVTLRPSPRPTQVPRHGKLTEKERKWAEIAWKYFEIAYYPETGIVSAVAGYPPITMWDIGSYLGALVAAYELKIISAKEFNERMTKLLTWFNTMDLFRNTLPNNFYSAETGLKVDNSNQPGEIGWSAADIGRLLIWFRIVKERYSYHAEAVDRAVLRWDVTHLVDKDGTIWGAAVFGENFVHYQEGRLGYEEYFAKGYQLWGFNTEKASRSEPYSTIRIHTQDVPYDTRDPRTTYAHNYVVSESYILDGIELNWDKATDPNQNIYIHSDKIMHEFANRVYQVQEDNYTIAGKLTARTEHQLDGPPYFVYDTIFTDGYPWNTITDKGEYSPEAACIATKAAFGLWVLWDTWYTDLLMDAVEHLYDPEKGWYSGKYELSGKPNKAITCNNNGIILEILLFKEQGKLLKFSGKDTYWGKFFSKRSLPSQCLPPWKYQKNLVITVHE